MDTSVSLTENIVIIPSLETKICEMAVDHLNVVYNETAVTRWKG